MAYILTETDKKELLKYVGPDSDDIPDRFFNSLDSLLRKQKWQRAELKQINDFIKLYGLGYMLKSLFYDKVQHPEWIKFYGTRKFEIPPAFKLRMVGEMMNDGVDFGLGDLDSQVLFCENKKLGKPEPEYVKYVLTESDKTELMQYVGCNIPNDRDQFFAMLFTPLLNKQKWKSDDLRQINALIKDGFGFMMKTLFQDKANHPEWIRYYGQKNFKQPINLDQLKIVSEQVRQGIMPDLSELGLKIVTKEEIMETDHERKNRKIAEKGAINQEATKKTRKSNKNRRHKGKH